jgi:O-antigen ligase
MIPAVRLKSAPPHAAWRIALESSSLVSALFIASVATVDISAFSVYRYLLISDVLLLAAAVLSAIARRSTTVFVPKLMEVLFVVYLTSTAFAFLRPVHPAYGLLTWVHSVFLMLVYVPAVTTLLVNRPDLRRLLLPTLLISTTIQSAITVAQVARGLNWQTGTRIPGAFGSVHMWPYVAAITAIVALLMTRPEWRTRAGALCCLAVVGAAEAFRKSRMLWIGSVLGGTLFAFVYARNKVAALVVSAVVCMALTAGYAFDLYHPAVQERITAVLNPTETPDLIQRIRVVEDLTREFVESPIVGLGIQQSEKYLAELPSPPLVIQVHNVVMHAAVEGGIVAALALALLPLAIILLWVAGVHVRRDLASRLLVHWAGASLIAIYLAAQLTPALFEHTFYLLIAALASFAWPDRSDRMALDHAISM